MVSDSSTQERDEQFMRLALDQAALAERLGDLPIGAVAVRDGAVIAVGHNTRHIEHDPLGHAELSCLREVAADRNDWRLTDITIYVTLEPCPMCAGALWASRVDRVVFGAYDLKAGSLGSLYNLGADPRLNHEFEVRGGVLAQECSQLLTKFFSDQRAASRLADPTRFT